MAVQPRALGFPRRQGGSISATRPLQRSPTDLLVHYFEVNFDEVAEELARALEESGQPPTSHAGVQLRQRAASNLRELIRSLIALRAHHVQGVEQALQVAEGLPGLEPGERELIRGRMLALMSRSAEAAAGVEAAFGARPAPTAEPAAGPEMGHAWVIGDAPDRRATRRDGGRRAPGGAPGQGPQGSPGGAANGAAAPGAAIAPKGLPAATGGPPASATPDGPAVAGASTPTGAPAENGAQAASGAPAWTDVPVANGSAAAAGPAATNGAAGAGETRRPVSGVAFDQRHGRPAPMASVLQALVAKAVEVLGADLCQVFLAEEDVLTLRAEAPPPTAQVHGPGALSPVAGFAGNVLQAGAASTVVARGNLEGSELIWLDRGIHSLAAVGMGSADPRSGLLVVGRVRPEPFDSEELSMIQNLAVETSLALASADLVSRAEELVVLGERLKLAREIHDGLASDLSAVVALFKYHEQRRKTDPEDADRLLAQMRGLVEDSLRSARDILATLRPRQRVQGSVGDAVRRAADEFARTYGVNALVSILGTDENLLNEERDTIFQVLREALTNVRKHAQASAIEVCLDMRGRPFILTVDDDGVGMDTDAAIEKSGSFGITGMRERAELVGGWVDLGRSPTGGTRLTLHGADISLAGKP